MKRKPKVSRFTHTNNELCRNPWNGRCESSEIALYIFYDGERLPICWKCWNEIAEHDLEWGNEPEHSERLK